MKEIYYAYNNEAIASCTFLSLLNETKSIEISRLCLILPFLLDNRVVNYLLSNNEIALDLLMKQKPHFFVSFNKRYLSLLPVSINAVKMLYDGSQISIKSNLIQFKSDFDNIGNNLGERFNKINQVIPVFLSITDKYSTTELYKILNIQL